MYKDVLCNHVEILIKYQNLLLTLPLLIKKQQLQQQSKSGFKLNKRNDLRYILCY